MKTCIRYSGPGFYAGRTVPAALGGEIFEAEFLCELEDGSDAANVAARLNGYGTPFRIRSEEEAEAMEGSE